MTNDEVLDAKIKALQTDVDTLATKLNSILEMVMTIKGFLESEFGSGAFITKEDE